MDGHDDRPDEFRSADLEDFEREDGPYDLAAYRADDALLDALGSPDPGSNAADDELGALLLAWRQETDSEPVPELIDTDTAVSVIASARTRTARRRHRFLVPVASAAAVLAIGFTGVGLAAKSAEPGDTLWNLTKVLYAEHAQSVEAASGVRSDLQTVRDLMRDGKYDEARALLDKARNKLDSVKGDDGKNNLDTDRQTLLDRLNHDKPSNPAHRPSSSDPGTSKSTSDPTPVDPPVDSSPPEDTGSPSDPPDTGNPSTPEEPPNESEPQDPPGDGGGDGGSDTGEKPTTGTEAPSPHIETGTP